MVQCSVHSCYRGTVFWIRPEREFVDGDNKISIDDNSVSQPVIETKDLAVNNSLTVPKILEKIGFCESGNEQYQKDGTVKRGTYNKNDIGKYQINLTYWEAESRSLGFDLFTEEGNTKMALHILEQYGTTPWNWSRACWK